jgi:imidazolonepropionase-like amidohydrolase
MNWIFFAILAAAVPLFWLRMAFLARRCRSAARLLMLLPLVVAASCVGLTTELPAPPAASPTLVAIPPTDAAGEPLLVLSGGTLIDGNGGPPLPDAVLMIRGQRILAAGRRADATIPAGAQVIDVRGATILPGFINAHVHAGYNTANLKAWAQAGVTTVRDLGVAPWDDAFVRRDAFRADPANARLVAAGPLVTVPGGYPMVPWGMAGLAVTSPQDAISQTKGLLDAGADIIKIALDSGGSFGRQIPILSPQEAAAIVQTAHARGARVSAHVLRTADLARGARVSAHVLRTADLARALDAGADDIAHMVEDALTDALISRMVAAGTYWAPTLELWQRVGLPGNRPVTNLGRFVKAGGLVALGTDYAGYAAQFDLGMPVTEIGLMAEAGMTPMQIIVAATKNAAIVCGLGRELGTLEAGRLADVLVVDGDPLADPSTGSGQALRALTQTRLVLREGVIIRHTRAP